MTTSFAPKGITWFSLTMDVKSREKGGKAVKDFIASQFICSLHFFPQEGEEYKRANVLVEAIPQKDFNLYLPPYFLFFLCTYWSERNMGESKGVRVGLLVLVSRFHRGASYIFSFYCKGLVERHFGIINPPEKYTTTLETYSKEVIAPSWGSRLLYSLFPCWRKSWC